MHRNLQNPISVAKEIIAAYIQTRKEKNSKITINGICFYYDKDYVLSDDDLEKIRRFSNMAEDKAYTVYKDKEELVIY